MTATQQTLRLGRPLWIRHSKGRQQRYPALSGNHNTSVAIVGGGMTGALVAHAFASAGIPTILLEAGVVGRGSTAASSALLLQEPDLALLQLKERYGASASRRIWQIGHESVRDLIALLERRGPLRLNEAERRSTTPRMPQPPKDSVANSGSECSRDSKPTGSAPANFAG